jgi:cellulose synthase/poly-beta-1,6-N-acetylglucosamine synthase-like glycosyltransferase
MIAVFAFLHVLSVAGLALFGLLGFFTLGLFLRHRNFEKPLPEIQSSPFPVITVQLPVYNEREVVGRLIAAACSLNYPRDRLQIQVLDDSTDETTEIARAVVFHYSLLGYDIELLHRINRDGFKAGALNAGMNLARGEYIAIFDADFQPTPDFLLQTLPHLMADDRLGMVQARWGHLNSQQSALTGAQAVALDKHFAIEQTVRFRADFFPKFNGSAGIWRRTCLEGVGGWQTDTVCEDLCLSTRAILAGWGAHFSYEVVAPAELPGTILAYKNQQARWAMGSTQCLIKYGSSILHAQQHSLIGRLYSILSMSAYMTHALLIVLLLVQLPLLLSSFQLPSWMLLFSLLGLGQPILFLLAQQVLYPDWKYRLRNFPILLLVAVGMAPSNTWAVMQAIIRREFTFVRTPKGENRSYRLGADRLLPIEIALALYSAFTLMVAISHGIPGPIALLIICMLGFSFVAGLTIAEMRTLPRTQSFQSPA